jgi:lipid II:glycine glycyltransferase (peptidoglycan interpeptide bridge formation enzyme)
VANISAKTITQKDDWENFIALHPEANFLHSWYWGDFHLRLGHRIERLGFYDDTRLVGVLLAIVEPAKRGRHIVIAGGPILDWSRVELIQLLVQELRRIAQQHRCLFVRVRPQLIDSPDVRRLFKNLGFITSPMHVTADLTSQLDLTKSNDELKRQMRKGARYDLNRSQKLGVEVEATMDERYLQEFCDLQLETARRQKFVSFSPKFLTEQFRAFARDNKVVLYRASYQSKLLAMAFIIFYGSEAAYHYGASTELAREIPGAYAIQWEAIQEARKQGCTRYNFWGVTEHGHTKHRFYGVSVFKRGFGGQDVAYLPARDLVVNRVKYPATYLFETIRRKARHL